MEESPTSTSALERMPAQLAMTAPCWRDGLLLALADGFALLVAMILGDLFSMWWVGGRIALRYSLLMIPAWWLGALYFRLLPGRGCGHLTELSRLLSLLLLLYGAAAVALFLSRMAPISDRLSYMVSLFAAALLIPAFRTEARRIGLRVGAWGEPVPVMGPPDKVEEVVRLLEKDPTFGYWPIRWTTDPARPNAEAGTEEAKAAMIAGTVIMVLGEEDMARAQHVLDALLARYRSVILVPPWTSVPSFGVEPLDLQGRLGFAIANRLLDPRMRALKRGFDLAVTLGLAPVWMPMVGLLALLVWLGDRRSPFYGQPRVGKNGEPFVPWKLRTMVVDADRLLEDRLKHDAKLRQEWESGFKLRADPRLTRVGRWLRRWSLDELPQLWNVLRGEMSLVGPRPLPIYHFQRLAPDAQLLRSQVPPGITGLWQVSGRSDTDVVEMGRLDIYYVRNWSFWLDALVLMKTLWAVLTGRGAY